MSDADPKEAMVALQEFAKVMEDVISELDTSIEHMQSLEQELGGEEAQVKKFGRYVSKEAVKNSKGGEFDKEKLSDLAANSEDLERSVEKVNGDLETEIAELKEMGEDLNELHEMSTVAEEALEVLKNHSSK